MLIFLVIPLKQKSLLTLNTLYLTLFLEIVLKFYNKEDFVVGET